MSEPGIESILGGIEKIAADLLTSDEERQKVAVREAPSSSAGAGPPAAGGLFAGSLSGGGPSVGVPLASGLTAPPSGASLAGPSASYPHTGVPSGGMWSSGALSAAPLPASSSAAGIPSPAALPLAGLSADVPAKHALPEAPKSVYAAGWRPFIGWIGGAALAYQFVLYPLLTWVWALGQATGGVPEESSPPALLEIEALWVVVTGMLGIAGMRSFDKLKGTQTDAIEPRPTRP